MLIGLHVAHWILNGRTLAPLELNEVMYTLEAGVVTAGFLLMITVVVASALFGRFFCSWACHVLALQDLCAWLLGKLRIRVAPVRSRVLHFVPFVVTLYMFVWPQVVRLGAGHPFPALRVLDDEGGWASFVTDDFWRNLPGPWVATATFAVCGFVMVVLLGSRSFCRLACPYGAVFALADRVAPGRIKLTGHCEQCGVCTARCHSGIRVHEEIARHGKVVDSACLKDLDCVGHCPQGALAFGLSRPAPVASWRGTGRARLPSGYALSEECVVAATFLAVVLALRGLHGLVPFFLALGLAAILAHSFVVALRLRSRENVRFSRWVLRRSGAMTGAGRAFSAVMVAAALLVGHSAIIRWHETRGERALETASHAHGSVAVAAREVAARHLDRALRWGLLRPAERERTVGDLFLEMGERRANEGRLAEAVDCYRRAVELRPRSAPGHYNLGVVLAANGDEDGALAAYRRSLALEPGDADAHNNLGFLLARRDDLRAAADHFRRAIAVRPGHAHAHFNLGRALLGLGDADGARAHLMRAAALDPTYARVLEELDRSARP